MSFSVSYLGKFTKKEQHLSIICNFSLYFCKVVAIAKRESQHRQPRNTDNKTQKNII